MSPAGSTAGGAGGFSRIENASILLAFFGAPTGTRTPVLALRGLCPRPLDDGGFPVHKAGKILPCGNLLGKGEIASSQRTLLSMTYLE